MKRKIAVCNIDQKAIKNLQNILTAQGYEVLPFLNCGNCVCLTDTYPDIILLDPYFSPKPKLDFLKELRRHLDCPIIAISALTSEKSKVDALDAGADDYIEKPISNAELLARIRAILRRIQQFETRSGMLLVDEYKNGGLTVDFNRMTVTVNGKNIHLTKNEFKILSLLCRYPNRLLSYEFIMKSVWGPNITEGTGILRVNITNIRRKLGGGYIETENGTGYRIC